MRKKQSIFRGDFDVTGFSHFVEKNIVLTNSIIWNLSREPKGLDYRDTTEWYLSNRRSDFDDLFSQTANNFILFSNEKGNFKKFQNF